MDERLGRMSKTLPLDSLFARLGGVPLASLPSDTMFAMFEGRNLVGRGPLLAVTLFLAPAGGAGSGRPRG